MKEIYNNVLETIGKTPLVRLNKLTADLKCTVVAKLESRNPGGSVKDRICHSMIAEAEKQGLIKPGTTIIERRSPSMAKGVGLRLLSRRGSWVQIPPSAPFYRCSNSIPISREYCKQYDKWCSICKDTANQYYSSMCLIAVDVERNFSSHKSI